MFKTKFSATHLSTSPSQSNLCRQQQHQRQQQQPSSLKHPSTLSSRRHPHQPPRHNSSFRPVHHSAYHHTPTQRPFFSHPANASAITTTTTTITSPTTTITRFPRVRSFSATPMDPSVQVGAATAMNSPKTLPPLVPPLKIMLNPPAIQKVSFFGTSSAVPQPGRANVSSLAIGLSSGSQILVDCGEATQHQLMLSQSLTMGKIDTILITHLHGDHFFGIFGLLASLGTLSRTSPLTVVGPKGLKNAIDAVFNTELAQTEPVPHNNVGSPGDVRPASAPTPLTDDSEHSYQLKIIEVPTDIPTLLGSVDRGADPSHPFTLGSSPGVDIMCVPIEHRVPCVGYVIHERAKVGRIDAKKAISLGAKPNDMTSLKSGQDLTLADGRVVYSKDVCDPPKAGKSIAVVQDTHDPTKFGNYFNNVDAMIHECTFDDELYAKSIDHGHSTPSMAANFAFAKNAKNLFLTHFSSRYEKEYPCLDLDGTTIFSPATIHDYVPRQLLCQLNPQELATLKNEINNSSSNSNNNNNNNNTPPPMTSPTKTKPQATITSKEHFANQMTDPTVDGCCGAGDDHHHHDEPHTQPHPPLDPVKRQRLDPQILAYQRDMPFYTQIRTNDYGIACSVQDLRAQAQFCVEQLWTAHQNAASTNLSTTQADLSTAMTDEGLTAAPRDDGQKPPQSPPTTSQQRLHNKENNNKNGIGPVDDDNMNNLQLSQIKAEILQLPQPIPSIEALLSMHQRAIGFPDSRSEAEIMVDQNKTQVWVGCDFRVFEFHAKTGQWSQGPVPDIDLRKYTAFKQKDAGKPAPLL